MRLLAMFVELHVFRGEVNWEQPLRIGVELSGRSFIRMWQQRCNHVGFDAHPLDPEDFGEVGRVEVRDVTDRFAAGLREAEFTEARIIHEATEPVGLALVQTDGTAFCLWVDEDEWRWGSDEALDKCFAPPRRASIGALL
jgi:hypothetical protein